MNKSFKDYQLTESETVWLNEVLKKDFKKFNRRKLKVKLADQLDNGFNPENVDFRFYQHNRITLIGLWHIDPLNKLFDIVENVINEVQKEIKKHLDIKEIEAIEIANNINISEKEVGVAFLLLSDLGFFQGGSYMKDLYAFKKATFWDKVEGYDKFLYFKNLESEMEKKFSDHEQKSTFSDTLNYDKKFGNSAHFINPKRIEQLEELDSNQFDLSRLIQLCKELNFAIKTNSYHSIVLLTRALIDHIPPIFGFNKFTELANNYSGGKSFKKLMQQLDNELRNIANSHIHQKIREKDTLPNFTQVNFSQSLDVLLSEIIRKLK
jgi:hypothetical protein